VKISSTTIKSIQVLLLKWYDENKRTLPWRESASPYGVWVSEVMLQQTQVKTVIPYYLKFMDRYPDIRDLAEADLEPILKSWEGLGYYARARHLHKAAGIVVQEMNGVVPDDFKLFLSLPGVGDYIASAVQSIAFGREHAVVDGNVKRVLARMFCLETPVNHSKAHKEFKSIADRLLFKEDPASFNQAVMELGALVCTPKNPNCSGCPLVSHCRSNAKDKVDLFPFRLQKKKVPTHHIAIGVVKKGDRVLITRRKLDGLLGGLWEFPGGKVEAGEEADGACVREILEETGVEAEVATFLTRVRHAYTHFKIEMDVFYCNYLSGEVRLNGPIDHKWIRVEDIDQFPFPRANLKFIPLLANEN
jgi:A/G-specific adenine glycosylase